HRPRPLQRRRPRGLRARRGGLQHRSPRRHHRRAPRPRSRRPPGPAGLPRADHLGRQRGREGIGLLHAGAVTMLGSVEMRRGALEAHTGPWRPRTLDRVLDDAAAAHPERPLVITDDRTYSYADMVAWSMRLARGLSAAGVRAGDHVAMVMANYPEVVALKFALSRLGAVAVPINFLFRRDELGFVIGQSDAVLLVTMNRFRNLDYLAALDELAPGWERAGGGERFPRLREVVVFSTDGEHRAGARSLDDLASAGDGAAVGGSDASAICDVVYTSGTTGSP